MTERDLQGEREYAEFTGWMEAQGYPVEDCYPEHGSGDTAEAFYAGMQAQRDLDDASRRLVSTWYRSMKNGTTWCESTNPKEVRERGGYGLQKLETYRVSRGWESWDGVTREP